MLSTHKPSVSPVSVFAQCGGGEGGGGAADWKQGRGAQALETAPTPDRHKHYLVPGGPLMVTPGP